MLQTIVKDRPTTTVYICAGNTVLTHYSSAVSLKSLSSLFVFTLLTGATQPIEPNTDPYLPATP
jgi:hypothetical protein